MTGRNRKTKPFNTTSMRKLNLLMILSLLVPLISCEEYDSAIPWDKLAKEIDHQLTVNILEKWYPACIDTLQGGYYSNLDPEFKPMSRQSKMIVSQSRHLWTTSMVASRKGDPQYLQYAHQGFPFLQKMWDTRYGGFFQNVDRSGRPERIGGSKTAYGNAFAIYGLSAYYDLTKDTMALNLAKMTFNWLEHHGHDPEHGGYFQILTREGMVIRRNDTIPAVSPVGFKDYNSSIHLLEAFTSLYKVWPDPLVRERLSEMFYLIKDVMINDRHYLNLYFRPNWEPVSFYGQDSTTILQNAWMDHVSFGHDIETAYLLLEASHALDIYSDSLMNELRAIVDHALKGWDKVNGGLFEEGYYFDYSRPLVIIGNSKEWWTQAETLNTLLIFHQHYPEAGYGKLFEKQWEYLKRNIIDPVNGGWYAYGLDTRPRARNFPKASEWKATYHNYRALANCLMLLEKNFGEGI